LTDRRLRVAVVYGGRSGEHEVSIESARSVMQAIDRDRYDVVPVGITQQGRWLLAEPIALREGSLEGAGAMLPSAELRNPGLVPTHDRRTAMVTLADTVDVVFPLVHGTYGEDGCLQGLFELAGIPYVGSSVPASAVGMDKLLMKAVFAAAGLPSVDYLPLRRVDWERAGDGCLTRVVEEIGFPCFVKPANLGSSVGISKVAGASELPTALTLAAEFSPRLIIERGIDARELECGVLGNHDPAASVVGEVMPRREFYDYEAKYHDPDTKFAIPAEIPASIADEVRSMAIRAFAAIGASGMARVDFFLERDSGRVFLNEINTIPGFTAMSVYPRLWAAAGVPYPELINRLIALAVERHEDQARNRTEYER
jgi:D-alanine-D-alanine ligase